jgi:hypothetical protein
MKTLAVIVIYAVAAVAVTVASSPKYTSPSVA